VGVRQGASTQGADAAHAAFSQFGLACWQTIDMPQMYWLDLFTVETWKEFLDHGGDVTGFREKRWKTVQKIKHGDYLLCYLTGASRWVGLLEVTSEPVYDKTPIWKSDVFLAG
jgi:predicted RNA-binding protein